jgi:alpha-beta hydrolase superfamily lysophospholipase
VLAPVLIAVMICVAAVLAVVRMERGQRLGITPLRFAAAMGGALLALYVFMSDAIQAVLAGPADWSALRPTPFRWPLFLVALGLMAASILVVTWPVSRSGANV